MELPEEIENIIERKIKEYNITDLKENALNLSLKYVNQKRTGQALLKEKIEAISEKEQAKKMGCKIKKMKKDKV